MAGGLLQITVRDAIREFIIDRRIRNCSADTQEWYRKRLSLGVGRFEDRRLSEIMAADVRAIAVEMMDRGLAARTINGMLQATKALLNWAVQEEIEVGFDPRRLKLMKEPQRIPEILSDNQIKALLEIIDTGTFWGRRDRMMILVMLDTGCRVSELCGMNVESVDVPTIRVIGKGDKQRILILSLQVQREMLRWMRVRATCFDPETGPLFPSRKHPHRLGRTRVGEMVRDHARKAGIPFTVTPHTFRRQYASAFIKGGGSIVHLQQILGHSDITMSRRYAAVFDDDCFEASMNLSPLVGLKWK